MSSSNSTITATGETNGPRELYFPERRWRRVKLALILGIAIAIFASFGSLIAITATGGFRHFADWLIHAKITVAQGLIEVASALIVCFALWKIAGWCLRKKPSDVIILYDEEDNLYAESEEIDK